MMFVLICVEFCRRYIGRQTKEKVQQKTFPDKGSPQDTGSADDGIVVPEQLMNVMFLVGFVGCITIAVIRSPLILHLETNQLSLAARSGVLAL